MAKYTIQSPAPAASEFLATPSGEVWAWSAVLLAMAVPPTVLMWRVFVSLS